MAFKFGKAAAMAKPATLPVAEVMPDSKETDRKVAQAIRMNEVDTAAIDEVVNQPIGPTTIEGIEGEQRAKLSKLVDDNFPFDESQLAAIEGIANQRYACLTGAAGTGKTTSTKAIVDRIQDQIGSVDMTNYFKRGDDSEIEREADDDYEIPTQEIPSICLVGFTGRSSQMIKKNFPRDWHGNIMTIHRMLAFMPEYYDKFDENTGVMRKTMRFIPTYTREFKLPWDVIVIDEAGMVSIELWEMVWAAAKEGCRIIMIGDINQLPPVHGRSIFGFAMTNWPSWELTHIHRQEGKNNSIVDNAWSILKGIKPKSDDYQSDPGWKFAMMPIPEDSALASQKIRAWLAKMNGRAYQPHRDSVITATNGEDMGRGYALGQIPMNRELALVFNKDAPRYIIDAGRDRKSFACGDKVMATRNDHENGITNGMTGVITNIERNGAYAGDWQRYGEVNEVARYMAEQDDEEEEEFSLDELVESHAGIAEGMKMSKEGRDRGPASHIVTVRFGDGETSIEMPFASLAEVGTLMTAYVVTCHKMQGGESPLVVVICHQSHKAMLNREWLYTAVTRASQKCVLFFTDLGLRAALNKQRIKGSTLKQKVQVFQELQTKGIVGAAVQVDLPAPESFNTALALTAQNMLEQVEHRIDSVKADPSKPRVNPFLSQIKPKARVAAPPAPTVILRERIIEVHHHHAAPNPTVREPIDLVAQAKQREVDTAASLIANMGKPKRIPEVVPESRDVVPASPVRTHVTTTRPEPLRLTHQPASVASSESVPQVKQPFRFGRK